MACADLLITFQVSHLVMHLSPQLDTEWLACTNAFAIAWYSAMLSHNRIRKSIVNGSEDVHNEIDNMAGHSSERAGLLKDFHLVQAAVFFDKRLVSNDRVARDGFARFLPRCPSLNGLLWADMTVHGGNTVKNWIAKNADYDLTFYLH